MVSKGILEEYQIKVGDSINYKLTDSSDQQEFLISGVVETSDLSDLYVWVNKSVAQEIYKDSVYTTTGYLRLKTDKISSNQLLDFANTIIKGTTINSNQLMLTEYFSVMTGADRRGYYEYYFFTVVIVLILASTIIYSIFYNSIIKDIKMYGHLRIIGLTKQQIKRILRIEVNSLFFFAVTIGLSLGLVVSCVIQFEGARIIPTIIAAICVSIIIYLVVNFSLIHPLKIAANISPVEAKIFEPNRIIEKGHRTRRVSIFYFAWRSFVRNKGTTLFSIIVLALSITCMIVSSMINLSLDTEKKAEFSYFPDGQFQISIKNQPDLPFTRKSETEKYAESKLQLEDNPLNNPELNRALKGIKGVMEIKEHNGVYLNYEFPSSFGMSLVFGDLIPTISEAEYSEIAKLISIPSNYKLFSDGGVLVSEEYAKVDESVNVSGRGKDGREFSKELTVISTFSVDMLMEKYPIVPGSPQLLISEEYIKKMTGLENQLGILSLEVNPNLIDFVHKELIQTTIIENVDFISLSQVADNIFRQYKEVVSIMSFVSVILFVFGFVSLMNIRIASILLRKKEIGMYKAIGMTNRQLIKMLDTENILFLGSIILLGLVFGNLFGLTICQYIEKKQHLMTTVFPIQIQLGIVCVAIIIWVILHVVMNRVLKNNKLSHLLKSN